MTKPTSRPRPEKIQQLAAEAIAMHGGPELARVWYKFTCQHCGDRCTAPEPNVLPVAAPCPTCGGQTQVRGDGYALEIRRSQDVDWDRPTRTLIVRPPYASDRGDA